MKRSSRAPVLVLSAAFCGAAAFGTVHKLATPPPLPATQVREPEPVTDPAPRATPVAPGPLTRVAARRQIYRDGSYVGPLEDAYYGLLSVGVVVQSGRIIAIHVLHYPSDNPTSRYINSQALPMLKSEVIRAQNVFVYMVSGATLSSNAFLRSTYLALRQARS